MEKSVFLLIQKKKTEKKEDKFEMALNNSNLNSSNNSNNNSNNNNTNASNNNDGSVTVGSVVVTSGGAAVKPNENLVVRIDENSDDNLQALFDSVLKPGDSKRPLQVPFRMRKLPNSFFNPPSTGSKSPSVSHSRENSADSAFGSGTTTICSPNGASGINPITSRLQISHSRAHSSPASLQQTYAGLNSQNNNPVVAAAVAAAAASAAAASGNAGGSIGLSQGASAQQSNPTPIHIKQRSYDVVSAIQLREELGDLPPGWEQARTAEGQIYYLK